MSRKTAIYPGTFDPITHGHLDLVARASRIFEQVIVAVALSPSKLPMFNIEERLVLAQEAVQSMSNIEVIQFDCLLIDCAVQNGADVILRGLRAVSDFEYELQLAAMNRRMAPQVDTLFLSPAEQFAFISSSLVREVASLKGDVSEFVPHNVLLALSEKLQLKEE